MLRLKVFVAATLAVASAAVAQQRPAPVDTLSPVTAADDVTGANQLFGTVMSPFCPGLTLANCPSVYAETLRVSVRGRLAAGESPERIVESLVTAFGEGVRGAPRARGLGLVLWLVPFVSLLAGGIGVTWWLRRRGTSPAPLPASSSRVAAAAATPEELARLEAALLDYE